MSSAPLRPPIRVLIVDDQRAILAGVRALIDSEAPRMQVVGEARCAAEALDCVRRTAPDIVVLDADLGGEDGLALIPMLRASCDALVVVFTCVADAAAHQRARHSGATDLILKSAPGERLLKAILDAAHCNNA